MKKLTEICKKEKCTGCFACSNICPKQCIEMREDEYGYIYPHIDEEKCIDCKLCQKTCPQNTKVEFKKPITAYAMCHKEERIRSNSTSGGAATTFYLHILRSGGVVYGANNIEDGSFSFIRIDNQEELDKLKGSKYVHCYVKDTFRKIKEDLENNLQVLFIGTPCQVAGLKNFLKKDFERLITIDLICHGVPSQKYLRDEIKLYGEEGIDKVTFRDGKTGNFTFNLYNNCKLKVSKPMEKSYYYKGFMDALFYRKNCYECIYAQPKRVSDITIGDFWGLKEDSKLYKNKSKGVSVLLPITQKGIELIEACKDEVELEERSVEEAVNGNTQLRIPSKVPKNYDKFMKYYLKEGFEKAYLKSRTLKQRIKANDFIMRIYRKIKGNKK